MAAYYNEIEPYAAQWLRNLIKAGHIADGEVDTRSIVDVSPDDVRGFTQAHFFAGIGGWSHALRLSGWPDHRKIWTGSCPCQPFSVAGKGDGVNDPRHLWPHFFRLIAAVRPPVVMGEQVAGAAGYGWLDGVRADLETEGYASRGVDIPACAVDAPHIRSRLYWVASYMGDPDHAGLEGQRRHGDGGAGRSGEARPIAAAGGGDVADANDAQRGADGAGGHQHDGRQAGRIQGAGDPTGGSAGDMADADIRQQGSGRGDTCEVCGVPVAECGTENCALVSGRGGGEHSAGDMADAQQLGDRAEVGAAGDGAPQGDRPADQHSRRGGAPVSPWAGAVWLTGSDGKARRAQPGIPLLAHGIPNRVGKLRAYGNAIVPPLAAQVIGAYLDAEKEIKARLNQSK